MSAGDYADLLLGRRLLQASFDEAIGEDWVPIETVNDIFCGEQRAAFLLFGYDVGQNFDANAIEYVSWLKSQKALLSEGDDYTGYYCKLNVAKKNQLIADFLEHQEQSKRIARLGEEALERALRNLSEQGGWSADTGGAIIDQMSTRERMAPGSNRVVTFSDNQVHDLDVGVTEVIDAVSGQNQLSDSPGLRELVLGQLKAGRELIRAGSARLYLLELSLIKTLEMLAKRYEKEAIGALAATLLTALVKHIGIDA